MSVGPELRWWNRPLSPWVDATLYGALFGVGVAALSVVTGGTLLIGSAESDWVWILPIAAAAFALSAGGYVWFFGPVYPVVQPGAGNPEGPSVSSSPKELADAQNLTVGIPLAFLPLFAAGLAVSLVRLVFVYTHVSTEGIFAVEPLIVGLVFVAVLVWGGSRYGVWAYTAAVEWRRRLGRVPRADGVTRLDLSRRLSRTHGAMISLLLGIVIVWPAVTVSVVEGSQHVLDQGTYRFLRSGEIVRLENGSSVTVPDDGEGSRRRGDPFDARHGVTESLRIESEREGASITLLVPAGEIVPVMADPYRLATHTERYGDRLTGPEEVAVDEWTVTATWLVPNSEVPGAIGYEFLVMAEVRSQVGDVLYLSASVAPDSQLAGEKGPGELTERLIALIDLAPAH